MVKYRASSVAIYAFVCEEKRNHESEMQINFVQTHHKQHGLKFINSLYNKRNSI